MFDSLTESLSGIFRKLAGKGRLSEKNIEEGLHQVRMALLSADVNYKVVKDFIDRVTQKAVGTEVVKGVDPTQQFVKVIYDEMVSMMGPVEHAFPAPDGGPLILMMVGLQGSGKTTTTAKLANLLRKKGRKPVMVAADVIRPAAIEQLKTLGRQNNIPVYAEDGGRPVKICKRGVQFGVDQQADTVLLDTQGRLHIDREMMDELVQIKETVTPKQILLVCDAMTGQDAVTSADQFHKTLAIDGVILTKMDGDARGGAAMSIKAVTGRPIRFIGVGEKIDELEEFHPDRIASRILGMGDVVSLVERAQQAIDVEQAKRIQEKIRKDELSLQDFYDQMQSMKKMGSFQQILKMIPGLGGNLPEFDEGEFKRMEAIIQSMTKQERENPELLNPGRRKRIARGSGTNVMDVDGLIKQFDEARRMIKAVKKGKGDLMEMIQSGGKMPKKGKKNQRRR